MKYKITPTGSKRSIVVEAASMIEVATTVKDLGISAKITKWVEPTSEVKWERKMFPNKKAAMDFAINAKKGTVKAQGNSWVWYAPKS